MVQNVYIHIPFCRQKCKYCSFISFPKLESKEKYLLSLRKEIISKYKNEVLNTLYFGGGTPSLLSTDEFKNIIELFNTDNNTEITIEVNPETVNYEYLSELQQTGVNRLSIGCQTFNDVILRIIGRRHDSKQVIDVVKYAKSAGFNNISLDFIYGLPNQTIKDFECDLKKAVELDIQHISLYGLKIDEGCYFCNNRPYNLPDDDTQAKMYLKAIDLLSEHNFQHYEISNFALNGYESKHNLNYWDNNSYYGFGVAAHGYINGKRYSNPVTLEKYTANPAEPQEIKTLSKQEMLEEEIFLGLRRMKGIDTELINNKYNIDFEKKYKSVLDKYTSSGHLLKTDNGYCLSAKGILVSNYILADFIE